MPNFAVFDWKYLSQNLSNLAIFDKIGYYLLNWAILPHSGRFVGKKSPIFGKFVKFWDKNCQNLAQIAKFGHLFFLQWMSRWFQNVSYMCRSRIIQAIFDPFFRWAIQIIHFLGRSFLTNHSKTPYFNLFYQII